MKKAIATLIGALVGLGAHSVCAQPALGVKDYDAFYHNVVLKAGNASKAEWLASYDPVVNFVGRVRQDVEKLPEDTRLALARAVHDNGYWKGQHARVLDRTNPFLGASLRGSDAELGTVLTPEGLAGYRDRYKQGSGGYRFSLKGVADRAAFYQLHGKTINRPDDIPEDTIIVNANAQSWDDLVADSRNYPDPSERLRVIVTNQLNAAASALALMRGATQLSDADMDYATWVIWRYTGHFYGRDGWEKEPLIRVSYDKLPESEKVKDRPIWKAVLEALKTRKL